MKRLLCIFALAAAMSWASVSSALAAASDTFQITVTCNFISIILQTYDGLADYTTWAVGQKAVNTATTMTEIQGIKVVNTANVSTDLSAWVSTPATDWTNAAAAGANQYKLEMKCFDATQVAPDLSAGTFTITTTATPGTDIKTALAAVTNQWAYGKFTTPTSTTSGDQQTITVTVLSEAAA